MLPPLFLHRVLVFLLVYYCGIVFFVSSSDCWIALGFPFRVSSTSSCSCSIFGENSWWSMRMRQSAQSLNMARASLIAKGKLNIDLCHTVQTLPLLSMFSNADNRVSASGKVSRYVSDLVSDFKQSYMYWHECEEEPIDLNSCQSIRPKRSDTLDNAQECLS